MATLTEGPHPGGFLIWEVLRDYTRETVTLASGAGKLAPGTVLGRITSGGKFTVLAPGASTLSIRKGQGQLSNWSFLRQNGIDPSQGYTFAVSPTAAVRGAAENPDPLAFDAA